MNLSTLIIIGILAELIVTSNKAINEASIAMLSPMMISSELDSLYDRLDRYMRIGDQVRATEELQRFGIPLKKDDPPLVQIETVENYLLQSFDKRYNELVHYMPENLSSFFKLWMQTWDAENLKILYRSIVSGISQDLRLSSLGPTGNIDTETLQKLASSKRPREYISKVFDLVPREMVIILGSDEEPKPDTFDVAIDRAYAGYIKARISELKLKDHDAAWKAISLEYEYRDIVTMARLKKTGFSNEELKKMLSLERCILTETQYNALIHAINYESFYNFLLTTGYSDFLPSKRILNPPQLSEEIQNRILPLYIRSLKVDREEDFIIRSIIGIRYSLDAIRIRAIYPMEVPG